MKKNNSAFKERFQRWKNGELVYENGRVIPHLAGGTDGNATYKVGVPGVDYDYSNVAWENTLDPVVVTGNRPKKEKPYWVSPSNPRMSQLNISDAMKGVHTAVNPLLGWTSPGQVYGAIRDSENFGDFIRNVMRGNSGFVTKDFEEEHPWLSAAINIGGDIYGTKKILDGVRVGQKLLVRPTLEKEVFPEGLLNDKPLIARGTDEKFTTLYRKLTSAQLGNILRRGGQISPLVSEKGMLTLTSSKPRRAPYYIKLTRGEGFPIENVLEKEPRNLYKQGNWSTRMLMSTEFKPLITDPGVELYARINGKYVLVRDPFSNKELQIPEVSRRKKFSSISEKSRGAERKLDDHTILTTPERPSNFTSNDYVMNPYAFSGVLKRAERLVWIPNDNGLSKHVGISRTPDEYFSSSRYLSSGNKDFTFLKGSPFVESGEIYYPSPYVLSTNAAFDVPRANSKELDLIREYIEGKSLDIHPFFDSEVMQHSLLDYYKNVYGLDLTGLDWSERAKFMLMLKDDSGRELLFHSTNHPFTKWDPSKITTNAGNEGFFGRGLYTTDIPTEDYGMFLIPLTISKPTKQAIIEITPGTRRFTSPMQDVDDALAAYTKPSWHFGRGGKYKPDYMYSPYPGMDAGGRPDLWNKWLRDNHIDLVRAAASSKGGGLYAETLIPEHTSVQVKPLFRPIFDLLK